AGLPVDRHASYHAPAFAFRVPASANARILGEYRFGDSPHPATVLMKRGNGTCAALLGAGGFELICTSSGRVLFLYRLLDEMAGGRLPAIPAEPVQCNIVPRVDDSGKLRCVTVTNTTIGTQRAFELRLRGVPETAAKVEYVAPSTGRRTLELRRNGAECTVTVPEIRGWDICYLKIM
ncbi:MAG: hypothetical protein MJ025_07245, partial [Victivallaceae bacterium]|nr:hypothetical protein [Victivallaceae bacterium]